MINCGCGETIVLVERTGNGFTMEAYKSRQELVVQLLSNRGTVGGDPKLYMAFLADLEMRCLPELRDKMHWDWIQTNYTADAMGEFKAERRRQIEKEGWSAEHDDGHVASELGRAGEAYYKFATGWGEEPLSQELIDNILSFQFHEGEEEGGRQVWVDWPWTKEWLKPSTDPARNLQKAGALMLAEIERLQRRVFMMAEKLGKIRQAQEEAESAGE